YREGHLRDVGKGGAELAGEAGGGLWVEVVGVVEEVLGEPEGAAAEDVQGVVGLRDGEPAFAERADHGVDVLQRGGSGRGSRLDGVGRPGVSEDDSACGECQLPQRRLPVGSVGAGGDLADHGIDHAVDQVVLVAYVGVEGHRFDAQFLRESAHADRLEAVPIGELDAGGQHSLPGQLSAAFGTCGAQCGDLHEPILLLMPTPISRTLDTLTMYGLALRCTRYAYIVR